MRKFLNDGMTLTRIILDHFIQAWESLPGRDVAAAIVHIINAIVFHQTTFLLIDIKY